MDRNRRHRGNDRRPVVALRKESVDRNAVGSWRLVMNLLSLSARRAWIEILYQLYDTYAKVSLSARRAWIEIAQDWRVPGRALRSLSARRAWIEITHC